MKKEEIRKEFFKLRIKGHSYSQCIKLLKVMFGLETTKRTLQRWTKRINSEEWNLKDNSTKPKTIHYKITSETENKILLIRGKTGFGEKKLIDYVDIGHTSVYKILRKHNLTKLNENRRKRLKYIRWQRHHPNSLWQMDLSDQKVSDNYLFAVIDDCSRNCLALVELKQVSTAIITKILDELIAKYGKPREILTDNGSVFGLRSKHSKFDRWCRKRGIVHIRTAIHSPTTTGKIERFFQTLSRELEFCKDNIELFRMRYNHFRPHSSLENLTPAGVYNAFHKLF
jgi:hypothetical protein